MNFKTLCFWVLIVVALQNFVMVDLVHAGLIFDNPFSGTPDSLGNTTVSPAPASSNGGEGNGPTNGGEGNPAPTTGNTGDTNMSVSFANPIQTTSIQEFISRILDIVVTIAIPIAIFFIVYAGFLLTTARGNEEQLKRGKGALLWALVGSAVILGAQLLSEVVKNTINNL